ncbi:hypothetical protein Nepgr_000943 [Nepenthes gracilis]|uniref:Homeobox domain-containing protein n=1 Tax=Nepenthes gracilis TaxID=150966 RepID=A0AAD3RWK5_NEPGR|nr:hypothetical protein Nepgr_000943 [Nepenthes gracilis]
MERELNLPVDVPNHNHILIGGFPSQAFSGSLVRPTLFEVNAHDHTMTGLPLLSALEGETIKDLHGSHNNAVSSNGLLTMGNSALGEVSLPQDVPSEAFRALISSSCSKAVSSAAATSLGCGYGAFIDDMNDRWDLNKFFNQPELSWKPTFLPTQFCEPNGWISPNNAVVCPNLPFASSNLSNELSLSLVTCGPSVVDGMKPGHHCSHTSSGNSREPSRSFGSTCNSAQFSRVISRSRYLHIVQEILSEIASYSLENIGQMNYNSTDFMCSDTNLLASSSYSNEFPIMDGTFEAPMDLSFGIQEDEVKKSQLLSLLQMIDDRYNQCLDEIHMVISAFHAATELDHPQSHSRFALETISFLYKNLRERISSHILRMGMHADNGSAKEKERSFEKSFIQKQWALQQLRRKDQQLWRPQRGLPERSVSVLRAWMFQNFLHPYPKDAEKHLLAIKSGLTRSQVSNWFINARVRLWKPLIEEMYAELNRTKDRQSDQGAGNSNCRGQMNIYNQRFDMN